MKTNKVNELITYKTRKRSILNQLPKSTLSLFFYILSLTALLLSVLFILVIVSYSSKSKLSSSLNDEITQMIKKTISLSNSTELLLKQNTQMKEYSVNDTNHLSSLLLNITLVQKKIKELKDHKHNYYNITQFSSIIKTSEEVHFIQKYTKGLVGVQCYSSKQHDFFPNEVRNRCKDYNNTIVLYNTVNGDLVGGYTSVIWNSSSPRYMTDDKAFLFSLTNRNIFPIQINAIAVQNHRDCFPSFGLNDIVCCLDSKCTSKFPSNFGNGNDTLNELFYKSEFDLISLEVYQIIPLL